MEVNEMESKSGKKALVSWAGRGPGQLSPRSGNFDIGRFSSRWRSRILWAYFIIPTFSPFAFAIL
jgi:hypothetical protein